MIMGAFLLVIAVGALVISWLTSQATQNAFNLYTTRSGQSSDLILKVKLAGGFRPVEACQEQAFAVEF